MPLNPIMGWWASYESIGNARMETGTEDVQAGYCAVVIASATSQADVINRRDSENTVDGMSAQRPNEGLLHSEREE